MFSHQSKSLTPSGFSPPRHPNSTPSRINIKGTVAPEASVTVRMTGVWQGDQGRLTEDFSWSDGTRSQRIWHITRQGPNHYRGRADDVKGEAAGVAEGNALQWRYTLLLPVDDKVYEVQFDDWMYLIDDEVLLNRSQMRKFGIRLGEVFIAFRRGA